MGLLNFIKKITKTHLLGIFLGLLALSSVTTMPAFAVPDETQTESTSESTEEENTTEEPKNVCDDQTGAIAWLICPSTGVIAKAVDSIYGLLQDFLVVKPLSSDNKSPIFVTWQYMRDATNIAFVIVLLIVVVSQVTGLGLSNYGIKRMLPRIIVAAILVNLSFILCSIAVDVSNIFGTTIRDLFAKIQEYVLLNSNINIAHVSWSELFGAIVTGGAIAGVGIALSGGLGALFWAIIPVLFGALLSVAVALITVSMRQALVAMLIMVSPIAFVAYLLPNTEKYFKKWLDILTSMLVFFPMFSLLFGASQLIGWSLIADSVNHPFWIILGMAVQVIPLFLCIPLMKLSGTVLGSASRWLTNLTEPLNRGAKNWGDSRRAQSAASYAASSNNPGAHLRRYLDYRTKLRELDTQNSTAARSAYAEIRAKRRVLGLNNYRAGVNENERRINSYTRRAKLANTVSLEAQTAEKDLQHALNNYDKYRNFNKRTLDNRLNTRSANAFLEANRANFTAMNDEAADIGFVTGEYLKAANAGNDSDRYKHYILGGAGALGEQGTAHTIAQVIAQSAAIESRQRRDISILVNKFGHNKAFRSMAVGYFVDDNGLAVDKNGNSIIDNYGNKEKMPGQFLKECPEKLIAYDIADENGNLYYDMHDQKGNFITRVYKKDKSAMKEIFANFDMPINDPINGLYGILSGINEGDYTNAGLKDVGLSDYSTTIGRSILSSNFKEKAAFAGPMYATSVGNQYIKDFVHQNLARLDNLNKTAKAGNFNNQDAAEIGQLAILLNPDNWTRLFPTDSLETYLNVNGEPLKATVIDRDENGKIIYKDDGSISLKTYARNKDGIITEGPRAGQRATRNELMDTVLSKFLLPFAPKATSMMARFTQNTADNQKPGTAQPWNDFYQSLDHWNTTTAWGGLKNPFSEQTNNTMLMSRKIRDRINPYNHNDGKSAYDRNNPASSNTILADHRTTPNITFQIEQCYDDHCNDQESSEMINAMIEYLQTTNHPSANRAIDELQDLHQYDMESPDRVLERVQDIILSNFSD